MKCPKCGNEVDTSMCVACPNCRTKMPNANAYANAIGMQDGYGNVVTVGGALDKPRKKASALVGIIILIIVVAGASVYIGINVYKTFFSPMTHEEAVALAKRCAKEVVNKQIKYENLSTWYANDWITDDGNQKFIIYCDVYGTLTTGDYGRIQMYVGVELKGKIMDGYTYWTSPNVYPNGDKPPNEDEPAYTYVAQLKNEMKW